MLREGSERQEVAPAKQNLRMTRMPLETSMEFPKIKNKKTLPFDPVIPLLRLYPKTKQNTNSKEYRHVYVHCSVFIIIKI